MPAWAGQLLLPHPVDGDAGELDAAVDVVVGVLAGLAVVHALLRLPLAATLLGRLLELRGVAAQEKEQADHQQAADATADGDAASATDATAARAVAALSEI